MEQVGGRVWGECDHLHAEGSQACEAPDLGRIQASIIGHIQQLQHG